MRLHRAVRFLAFGLLLLIIPAALSTPSSAQIGIGVSVRIGPPALPVYEQPLCPGPGYLWTPGYWAWSDDDGYYWVPGTWVVAPVGMLWTPGYWGWGEGVYLWHAGYWGPHIGFYGGINYGFGYGGVGFYGGEWRHGAFFYNSAVTRVDNVHITNVYVNRTVIVHNESHVAFNGGEGGVRARATASEESAAREPHREPLAEQRQHEHAASQNRTLFASQNHGRPAVAATGRPGQFSGHGVVAAKAAGAAYHAPAISPRKARASAPAANHSSASASVHSNAASRPFTPPNKGNTSNSNRTENNTRVNANSSASASARSNAANRPFTPPNRNNTSNSNRTESNSRPNVAASRPSSASRPPARTESAPRAENSRSQSQPRPQSAPRAENSRPQSQPRPQSAPSARPAPAPAPRHQSAPPREERHGGH